MNKMALFGLGFLGTLGVCASVHSQKLGCTLEQTVQDTSDAIAFRSQFEMDAERLNIINPQYQLTAEDLIFITRLVYHEQGSFLVGRKNGFSDEEIIHGYEAISAVLLNRFNFDRISKANKFHGNKKGLIAVVTKPGAFKALNDSEDFSEDSFRDENGELTLGTSNYGMISREAAYDAVVKVLSRYIWDPTLGSLFYKTQELGNSRKVVWHGSEAFWLDNKRCIFVWKKDIAGHQYYGVNCEGE
ncbi:hypothetical protein J4477_03930 [Candidatus Pacearchaeota archaeon]|nr:hypothetical protein [Candidatus Pacearchaeota archaeon]